MSGWKGIALAVATTTAGASGGAAVYELRQTEVERRLARIEAKVDAVVCLQSRELCGRIATGGR